MTEREDRGLWWGLAAAWLFCGGAILLRLLMSQGRCRAYGPWLPCDAPSDAAVAVVMVATLAVPAAIVLRLIWRRR